MSAVPGHPSHQYQHQVPTHNPQVIFAGRRPANAVVSHGHQNAESSASLHSSSRPASIMSTTSNDSSSFSTASTMPGPGNFTAFSPDAISASNTRGVDTASQYFPHRHSISTMGGGTNYAPYRNPSVTSDTSGVNPLSHFNQPVPTIAAQPNSFQPFQQLICAFCKTPVSPAANYHECLDCVFFKHNTIFCPTCYAMSPKHVKHHHDRSKFVASWDPVIHEPSWQIPGWEVRKTIMTLVWYYHKETKYKTFQRPGPPIELVRAQTVPTLSTPTSSQDPSQQTLFKKGLVQQVPSPQTTSQLAAPTQQGDVELPLPPGWREMMGVDDRIYYKHETTHEISWTRPIPGPQLSPGWEPRSDPDGREFYFNSTTQQATWDRPLIGSSFSIPGTRPSDPTAGQHIEYGEKHASTAHPKTQKNGANGMKSAAKDLKNNPKARRFIANAGIGIMGGLVKEAIGLGDVDGTAEVLAAVGMGVANAAITKNSNAGVGVGSAVIGLMDGSSGNDGAILAKMAMQLAHGVVDKKMGTGSGAGVPQKNSVYGVSQVGQVNAGQPSSVQGQSGVVQGEVGAFQGQSGAFQVQPAAIEGQSTPGAASGAGSHINMEALVAAIFEILTMQRALADQTSRPRQGGETKRRTKVMNIVTKPTEIDQTSRPRQGGATKKRTKVMNIVTKPTEITITPNEFQPPTIDNTVPPLTAENPKSIDMVYASEAFVTVPSLTQPFDSQSFGIVAEPSMAATMAVQENTSREIKQNSQSIFGSTSDSYNLPTNSMVDMPTPAISNAHNKDPVKPKKRRPVPTYVPPINPTKPQGPSTHRPPVPTQPELHQPGQHPSTEHPPLQSQPSQIPTEQQPSAQLHTQYPPTQYAPTQVQSIPLPSNQYPHAQHPPPQVQPTSLPSAQYHTTQIQSAPLPSAQYPSTQIPFMPASTSQNQPMQFPSNQLPSVQHLPTHFPPSQIQSGAAAVQVHPNINIPQAQPSVQQPSYIVNMPGTSGIGYAAIPSSQHHAQTGASYNSGLQPHNLGASTAHTPQAYVSEEAYQNASTIPQSVANIYHHVSHAPHAQNHHTTRIHHIQHHHTDQPQDTNSGGDATQVQDPNSGLYDVYQQPQFTATTSGPLGQGVNQYDLNLGPDPNDNEDDNDDVEDDGEGDDLDGNDDNESQYTETDPNTAQYEIDEDGEEEYEGDHDQNEDDSFVQIDEGSYAVADFQDPGQVQYFTMQTAETTSIYADGTLVQTETDTSIQVASGPDMGTDTMFQQTTTYDQESTVTAISEDTSWNGGMGVGMDGFFGSYTASETQGYATSETPGHTTSETPGYTISETQDYTTSDTQDYSTSDTQDNTTTDTQDYATSDTQDYGAGDYGGGDFGGGSDYGDDY